MKRKMYKFILSTIVCCFITVCTIGSISAIESNNENIVTKTLYLNYTNNEINISPYYTSTYQRHTVDTFSDVVRGKVLEANVTLKVTIRVNENTGEITSYSGPYLNQNWIDVGGYEGFLTDISTDASYSPTRRTLHCIGKFKIYARSAVGTDVHVSKQFTIEFDAG